jgi:hypothetical protein
VQEHHIIDPPLHLRLDRHLAAELRVLCAVYLTHATLAELGGDSVVGESLADQAG